MTPPAAHIASAPAAPPLLRGWLTRARRVRLVKDAAAAGAVAEPRPTGTDIQMMRRALALAEAAAARGEVPVGAVVYETATGRVLAEAANDREATGDPTGHAEHRAITAACRVLGDWRLNHATLAVTLEPCPMCAGLIVNARVGRVAFGAHDPKAGAARSLFTLLTDPRLNHRAMVIPNLLADEAGRLLTSFFRQRRRQRVSPPRASND